MTREEAIISEAVNYGNRIFGEKPAEYLIASIGFTDGALWADKNPDLSSLWHDASDVPLRTSCEILYEMRSNYGFQVTKVPDGLTADNWENVLKVCGIVRWAYVDDLLPKGGVI